MDDTKDNLGCAIDPGIKAAVVYLNLLGFCTTESCEGHTTHGCYKPWIQIKNPNEAENLKQWYREAEDLDICKLVAGYNEAREGNDDNAIYMNPMVAEGTVISIRIHVGRGFSDLDQYFDDSPVEDVLKSAREEMEKFTDFLIKKYQKK